MRHLRIAALAAATFILAGCAGVDAPSSETANATTTPSAPAQIPSTYKGIVATRGYVNGISAYGPTVTWAMNRSFHIARDTIAAGTLQAVWGNYLSSYAGDYIWGTATYKAAIEYPAGVITPCTFGGAATLTVGEYQDATTDPCGPAIPVGATFWVRMLYASPTGVNLVSAAGDVDLTREQFAFGTGTPLDAVDGGSFTTTGTNFWMLPIALVAPTTNTSVCIIGDSRAEGLEDEVTDATGDVGEIARSIGPSYGYTNLAVAGETAQDAVTQLVNRSRMFTYCSHVIDGYGVNDIHHSVAAADIVTARTALAKLTGLPTWGTTLMPWTTSTDGWATLANETTEYSTDAFNKLVRAGTPGESGFFDVDFGLDPGDLQKFPPFTTPDGIHENDAGNIIIRDSGVVNPGLLVR